jgi:hypothetical protein
VEKLVRREEVLGPDGDSRAARAGAVSSRTGARGVGSSVSAAVRPLNFLVRVQ